MKLRNALIILTIFFNLTGCSKANTPVDIESHSFGETQSSQEIMRHLQITLENTEDLSYKNISKDLPEGTIDFEVVYHDVTNVMITLDGKILALEDALKSSQITPEEIICYAQLDAADNFCFEYATSTNGLTKLVYNYYDQFDLVVFYDVYETPDGSQHLIKELHLCRYYDGRQTFFGHGDIDSEDWGLTFEPTEITPTGLTLRVTHEQGQQIGTLHILQYALVNQSTQKTITLSSGDVFVTLADQENNSIANDGITQIVFDWSASHGTLPSGAYKLIIDISDVYDESQVHPLMKNFEDTQFHHIEFSIPKE